MHKKYKIFHASKLYENIPTEMQNQQQKRKEAVDRKWHLKRYLLRNYRNMME